MEENPLKLNPVEQIGYILLIVLRPSVRNKESLQDGGLGWFTFDCSFLEHPLSARTSEDKVTERSIAFCGPNLSMALYKGRKLEEVVQNT